MKITPGQVSHSAVTMTTNNNPNSQARANAIAMLETNSSTPQAAQQAKQAQTQQSPVQNQNQVSVEEMGAVIPKIPQGTAPETDNSPIVESEATEVEAPRVSPEEIERRRRFQEKARQERNRIAQLRKQEASVRSREEAIRAKEAELLAKEEEYSKAYIRRERLKQDPLSALAEAEVSYDDIAQQLINQQPTDPRVQAHIQRLEAKLQQLENANEQMKKASVDQQTQTYQAAVKQIENDVKNLVKIDPNYETIRATKSIPDVVDLIVKTYEKDGVLLSVDEAAQEVENYLLDETLRLTRLGKIQKRLREGATKPAAQPKKQPDQSPQQSAQQQQMKTLTNATSSTRRLTSKERAILAFKGQLNNT